MDNSCQAGDETARAGEERAGDVAQLVTVSAPLICGGGCANSTTNEVAASTALAVEKEVGRRMAAVLAAAAAAESGLAAWARAFSSARQLIHEALLSLCEHTTILLGAEGDSKHTLVDMLSKGLDAASSNDPSAQESNAVVPWVPSESKTEASTALEVLRDGVESAVDGIRSALAGHAARMAPTAAAAPTEIQHATTASQTEKESQVVVEVREGVEFGQALCPRQCTVGVQVGELDKRGAKRAVGGGGGEEDAAPAWEGGRSARSSSGRGGGADDRERRRKQQLADDAMVEELRRKAGALSEALQRAETEKEDLERSLTQRFEREQVKQAWALIKQ